MGPLGICLGSSIPRKNAAAAPRPYALAGEPDPLTLCSLIFSDFGSLTSGIHHMCDPPVSDPKSGLVKSEDPVPSGRVVDRDQFRAGNSVSERQEAFSEDDQQ
jgi:hypothetical protein